MRMHRAPNWRLCEFEPCPPTAITTSIVDLRRLVPGRADKAVTLRTEQAMQREARRRIERRAEVGQVRADAERESAEIVGRLYDATAASGPPWRGTGRRR
jgi:hypothetical protein